MADEQLGHHRPQGFNEPREFQQLRDVQQPQTTQQPRELQQSQAIQQPQEFQQPQAILQPRELHQLQAIQQPRELQQPQAILQPRELHQPQAIQQPRELQQPQAIQQPRELQQPQAILQPRELQQPQAILQHRELHQPQAELQQPQAILQHRELHQPQAIQQPRELQELQAIQQPREIQQPQALSQILGPHVLFPKFSGRPGENFNVWVQMLKAYLKTQTLSDTEKKLFLGTRLVGKARDYFYSLPAKFEDTTIETYLEMLNRRFSTKQKIYPSVLNFRKQRQDESVDHYLNRVQVKLAGYDIPKKSVLAYVIKGLKAEYRMWVKKQDPQSLEDVRLHAGLAEQSTTTDQQDDIVEAFDKLTVAGSGPQPSQDQRVNHLVNMYTTYQPVQRTLDRQDLIKMKHFQHSPELQRVTCVNNIEGAKGNFMSLGKVFLPRAKRKTMSFGNGNTAVLMVAGVGNGSDVFKSDVEKMKGLLMGDQIGISGNKIFTVFPRPTCKVTTIQLIQREIDIIEDELDGSKDGMFIFYYSGHFGQEHKFHLDQKGDVSKDFCLDEQLAQLMMVIPAKYMLLILDMCYSACANVNAKAGGADLEEAASSPQEDPVPCLFEILLDKQRRKFKDGDESRGPVKVVQWSSSLPGQVSRFTDGKTSDFTKVIIDQITNDKSSLIEVVGKGNYVSVHQVNCHVSRELGIQQTPVINPKDAKVNYFKSYPYFAKIQ